MKVAVIDPSALLRGRIMRLVSALPQAGFVVASGRDSWLPQLARLDADLVILEIRGPVGASLRPTLARIRRIRKCHGRPSIVVLTNAVSRQHRQYCLDAGADFFLDKSLEFEKLPRLLRSLARARSSSQIPQAHEPRRASR